MLYSPVSIPLVLGLLFCNKTCMFLKPPSLWELRMCTQVKCSHWKPFRASIGRLRDLQVSFEDRESGRRYRLVPFPLYRYLLYELDPNNRPHIGFAFLQSSVKELRFFEMAPSLIGAFCFAMLTYTYFEKTCWEHMGSDDAITGYVLQY